MVVARGGDGSKRYARFHMEMASVALSTQPSSSSSLQYPTYTHIRLYAQYSHDWLERLSLVDGLGTELTTKLSG